MIGRLHELTAFVADEWPTIGHAIAGLRAIDEWGRRHDDSRGCFAAAYRIVTVAVDAALQGGDFVDPAWVTRVVLDFAGRYRLAVSAAAHGLPGPRCWAAALRDPQCGSVSAMIALFHAMIAHIHHDLAHSLGACAPIGPRRAADYERLGVVICGATLAIQRELVAAYVPDLRGIHTALRGVDTWLTVTLVRAWRARARMVAARMVASPAHALAWSRRLERESATLAAALDILTSRLPRRPRPDWPDRPLALLTA